MWRKAKVRAYLSPRQFSRSRPLIRCFTLAYSKRKKCTATTMIQLSLQLWPNHCTSVGGPIKGRHSSLWEMQPPVKDSSLEQHILKSGLGLPSVDSLAFSLAPLPTAAPGEHVSSSQHKDEPGESQDNPPSTVEAQHRNKMVPVSAPFAASLRVVGLTLTGTVGNCVVIQRHAGKQVQRQKPEVAAKLSPDCI